MRLSLILPRRHRCTPWIFLTLCALGPAAAGSSQAATLVVTSTASTGAGSLYQAILTANADNDGDVIVFDPTVFANRQTIPITASLAPNASMTIQGPASGVILDGSQSGSQYPGLSIESDSATTFLSNLIIQNNAASGLTNRFGTLTMTNCVVQGNSTQSGGGIFNDGTLTLINCTVKNNTSSQAGGGLFSYGTVTLTGCTVSGNTSGGPGGGIYNGNGGATLSLTNCVVTGNVAGSSGGGGISSPSGILTIMNCTFTGNQSITNDNVYGGGGALALVRGTTILTNSIFYGDTSPQGGGDEIFFNNYNGGNPGGTLTITDCDLNPAAVYGAAYSSSGIIDAAPQFISATDFHLRPGSPCLGAGTASGAPAVDKDTVTRPNPPSIGAYELIRPAHILWDNTNGTASIWNYDPLAGGYSQISYGPYAGWTAKTLADGGTDSLTRVLWTRTDGTASIWSLNNTFGQYSQYSFGPYAGWTAVALSVGTDNTTHLLWTNTDGRASLWNYNTVNGTFTQNTYGPYPGWSARALADGPDGKVRLLWNNTDERMSLWSLDNVAGVFTQSTFGPYSEWSAAGVSVNSGNVTHILWNNTNGAASVWNYSTESGSFIQNTYGPYTGWTAKAVGEGSDGRMCVQWNNTSGLISLWSLDNAAGIFGQVTFGPFVGWTAIATSGH